MKKIILITALALALSGCSQSTNDLKINEKNADKALSSYSDNEVISEIDKINSEKAQNSDQNANQNNNNNQMEENKSVTLEDLAQEYSAAILKTNLGDIKVKFYNSESPLTVNNFLNLAKSGFYDGTRFHRVIKDFMIQGGDPKSKDVNLKNEWGTGDPGYKFRDEFNNEKLVRGSLAMANSGPDTNGSQFFIVTAEATPWLDGKHTNFGMVTEGMDVVDKIEASETDGRDQPLTDVVVNSVELVK